MWGIIGTWEMSFDGVKEGARILKEGGHVFDALETCVRLVEDCEEFSSVGFGGLPNAAGIVELDAAFMDGETLAIGAVAALKDFANPCAIARKLMSERLNNFLVGEGAEQYAHLHGFPRKNMLTEKSLVQWLARKEEVARRAYGFEHGCECECKPGSDHRCDHRSDHDRDRDHEHDHELRPYTEHDGHDTVCAIGIDSTGHMAACTSTSGLFFKTPGRVGDSPLPGCGYYVDNRIGGACATGLGEDIMKGALSFQIVQYMGQGLTPQKACECAVRALNDHLIAVRGKAGDLSVIAMNAHGEFGAATNIDVFPFVAASERQPLTKYQALPSGLQQGNNRMP